MHSTSSLVFSMARRADVGARPRGDTLGASPRSGDVIMYARDPAEAVEVLNLLLKFFGDGERWIKGRFSDRRGNCCLVGALDLSAAITRSKVTRPSGIWPLPFPTRGASAFVAMRMARTMPGCGRPFVARCGANGIGSETLLRRD